MPRKKVNLAFIANQVVRRATFRKRCKSLIKKVSELSTLCDVPACILIYGPHDARPEVWPSEPKAREILENFRALPELEQSKRMMNQEGFLQQRVQKNVDRFRKNERMNREVEMAVLLYEVINGRNLHDVRVEDTVGLLYYINMRLKALYDVMETIKGKMTIEVEVGGNEVTTIAPTLAMEEMGLWQNQFSEMPTPTKQIWLGSNGSGELGDIVHPYMDIGSPWIMDPNIFSF